MITCSVCGAPATLAPIDLNAPTAGASTFPSGVVFTNVVDRPYCVRHNPSALGQGNILNCGVCGKPATHWEYGDNFASISWNAQGGVEAQMPQIHAAYCGEHAPFALTPVNTLERLYADAYHENERLRVDNARLQAALDEARGDIAILERNLNTVAEGAAAMLEIVCVVAQADNSDMSVCYQLCSYDMHWVDDEHQVTTHIAPCVVEQARALLGMTGDGEASASEGRLGEHASD